MVTDHQSHRRKSHSRGRRKARVHLEVLEDRRLLATDSWMSASSGSWNTAADWSKGVPQTGDSVVIDVAGADPTVTFTSGASGAYASLMVKDALEVSSGTLTTNSAEVNGALLLDGGQIAIAGSGGSINLAGTTTWRRVFSAAEMSSTPARST